MAARPARGEKKKPPARTNRLSPGTGLGGTITAIDAVKHASSASLPYRTAGNTNHTTKHLFSSYNYMSDPSSPTTSPSTSRVNPFPVTTLPDFATLSPSSSAPGLTNTPSRTSAKQPLYFAPLKSHPPVGALARQQSAPTSTRGSITRTVAPCHELERSWWSEPYVEQTYTSLYRAVRADRTPAAAWRGSSHTGAAFDKQSLSSYTDTISPSLYKSRAVTADRHSHRVRHLDAWNVGEGHGASSIGGRYTTDSQRMAGGVDKYEESPFELSERVMSELHPGGMRSGHRSGVCVGSGHSHANVKVAGSGLRDEKQYHSRKSADGQCYHHCTGVETKEGYDF